MDLAEDGHSAFPRPSGIVPFPGRGLTVGLGLILLGAPAIGYSAEAELKLLTADSPPFSFTVDGRPTGFITDIARAAAARAGLGVTVEALPWPRAIKLADQEPNRLIQMTRTGEREARYHWIGEVATPSTVFFTMRGTASIRSFEEAGKLRLVVRRETPFEAMLDRAGVSAGTRVTTDQQAALTLNYGRVDAWLTYDLRGAFIFERYCLDSGRLVAGEPLGREHVFLAASLGTPRDLVERLRAAIQAMKDDGSIKTITDGYFDPTGAPLPRDCEMPGLRKMSAPN